MVYIVSSADEVYQQFMPYYPHIVGNERREVEVAQRAGAAIRHEQWAAAYLILR